VHEAKWNGYRIQIVKDGQDVRLYSKGGREWTKRLPAIAEAFAGLSARSAIMDGELCFCDERGGPNFRALHHAMRKAKPAPERLVVFTFDLMHLNSADLRAKPLHERRRRMVDLVQDNAIPCMFVGDQFANGAALLGHCERFGLEGVVSKRRDAPYVSGECKAWVKSKCPKWRAENKERWQSFEGVK
jgi:bifunctional non-homologous end joining protein LigD